MGKSFVRLIIVLCCSSIVLAQDGLCVFKTNGTVLLELNKVKQTLIKGDFIPAKSDLSLLANSDITAIDAKGNAYFIDKEGDYSFNELLKHEKIEQTSNFTSNYFKYLWNKFLGENPNEPKIAGVYRGEVLMKFPKDSSKIASSKITLKWRLIENEKLYYVFVKNVMTKKTLKIETNGSQLALFDDNPIFSDGNSFEWAVTTQAFPNLNNLVFYNFNLIDRRTYEEEKLAFTDFINDLKQIGTSDAETDAVLCETYGLCK